MKEAVIMENEIASLLSKYSRDGQLADKKFYTDLYYLLLLLTQKNGLIWYLMIKFILL